MIGIYLSSDSDAATLREELTTRSLRVEFHKGSITDRVFVSEVMRKVQATFGRIDILVNNAGVVRDNFITQMSDEEWHAVFIPILWGLISALLKFFLTWRRKEAGGLSTSSRSAVFWGGRRRQITVPQRGDHRPY